MSVTTYNVDAGKDRATIELSGETKVVFSFDPNVIAVEAVSGEVNVSLDEGATAGDDGCDTLSEGQNTRMNPIADKCIYVNGTGTVKVWGGRSGEDCPFSKGGKGGGGSGGDGTHYKGTTTTALSNGSTANPISIDGEEYTAVFGDIVVYSSSEFIFDGTAWSEIGRGVDTTPTSGSANFVTSDGVYKRTPWGRGTGSPSAIMGNSHTTASGMSAVAMGRSSRATNSETFAAGYYAAATGTYSSAFGFNVQANSDSSHVVGRNNRYKSGDLFEVGNGSSINNLSNIIEVNQTSLNVNGDIQRDGVGIDDYTTTERKIGKWIDGSDLYQRTFEVTGLVNKQWNNSALGTSGINIVDAPSGTLHWLYNDVPDIITSLNYFRATTEFVTTCINTTAADVNILPSIPDSGYTVDKAVITIKYTKPSAQANLMQTAIPTEEVSETPTEEEDDMR